MTPRMDAAGPGNRALYETDEHAWMRRQIEVLRAGDLDRLDRETLAEYLAEMTARDRRELQSRLTVLLQHMLKILVQPERLSRNWVSTILIQQREIRSLLSSIPSLAAEAETCAAAAYPDAVRAAARETGRAADAFPSASPWTVESALAYDPPEPRPRQPRRG
jgi:hypothetical protein